MRALGFVALGFVCVLLSSCSGPSVERSKELIVGRWERTDQPGDDKDVIEFTADGKYKSAKSTRFYRVAAHDVLKFSNDDDFADESENRVATYKLDVSKTALTLTLVARDQLTDKVENYRRVQ